MICTILRFLLVEEVGCEPKQFNEEDWSCGEYDGSFDRMQIRQRLLKKLIHLPGFIKMRMNKSIQMREDDIFSKYEYLFHSDGEVREPIFKRVWGRF